MGMRVALGVSERALMRGWRRPVGAAELAALSAKEAGRGEPRYDGTGTIDEDPGKLACTRLQMEATNEY